MDFASGKARIEAPSTIAALAVAMLFAMVFAIAGSLTGLIRNDTRQGVGPEMAYDFGQCVGVGILSALAVWAVLHFAIVRSKAPDRGGRHLLTLIAASVIAALSPWVVGVTAVTLAEREPVVVMATSSEGMIVARRSGRPPPGIEPIVAAWRNRAERERAAAESARRDIFGAGLVQGYSLNDTNSLEDIQSRVTALRSDTDRAFARQAALLAELEVRVRTDARNSRDRDLGLRWVARERSFRGERLNQLKSRLDATYDETEAMIGLLSSTRGSWSVESGKIVFRDVVLQTQMDGHAARLHELAFEIDQIEGDLEREATAHED